jgi:hypothetical protein
MPCEHCMKMRRMIKEAFARGESWVNWYREDNSAPIVEVTKMSQWGKERVIQHDTAMIKVVPQVQGDKLSDDALIINILSISESGDGNVIVTMLQSLDEQFAGKPYSAWIAAAGAAP